jgi:hypothetical protein
LLAKEDSITLYVTGHGKPVDTKDGSAALTLSTVVGEPVRKYLFYKPSTCLTWVPHCQLFNSEREPIPGPPEFFLNFRPSSE